MNPEDQIQQGASEQPNAPQEVTKVEQPQIEVAQTEPAQTESTQTETVEQIQTESTIPTVPAETTQTTPIAPVAPKEKKGKSWIIILIIILVLLLALFGAIWWTSSKIEGVVDTFFYDVLGITRLEDIKKKEETTKENSNTKENSLAEDDSIIAANNKMLDELGSFDYEVTYTSETMGMSIDMTMNCTYDGKNSLEYCKMDMPLGMEQEYYYDMINRLEYDKITHSGESTNGWSKIATDGSTRGQADMSNADFTITNKEETENGTLYTGEIKSFTMLDEEADELSEDDSMNFEILINKYGYIDSMTMSVDKGDIREYVKVKYSNFGTAQSLSIPAEALNAE